MAFTKYWYMEAVSVVITPRRSSKGDTCPCTLTRSSTTHLDRRAQREPVDGVRDVQRGGGAVKTTFIPGKDILGAARRRSEGRWRGTG